MDKKFETTMERMNAVLNRYEAPQVEIIEVAVEKGFATSGEADTYGLSDYEYGGEL